MLSASRSLSLTAIRSSYWAIAGSVLRSNRKMLQFTESLGFAAHDDPDDPEVVAVVLDLSHPRETGRQNQTRSGLN